MLVTLDFETYYDKDYTLKKMSTSEYIRDDRFETLSCSIKIDDLSPFCYFGKENVAKALSKIDWKSAILLCHHTQFDGLILSHHFGIVPRRYACTLSMARALHPKLERNDLGTVAVKYGKQNKLVMPEFKGFHLRDLTKETRRDIAAYNNGDVESCHQIYKEMLVGFPPVELDLIDITIRMFADPVLLVDLPLAKSELLAEQTRRLQAVEGSGCTEEELSSNPKFVAQLAKLGVSIPTKPSPTVKDSKGEPKRIPAVAKSDEALQALLLHPDPKVVALVEGRLAAKSTMSESRAARLIARGKGGMKLPIYLGYAVAHTHRWAGGDKLNPQNFKQSHKVGGKLKQAIIAPPGYVIVKVDASQIEARFVAWLFDEEWVLDAFRDKRDIYCEFASDAYERVITKADEQERFVGKTCVLGLGFGMGGPKLQVSLLTKSMEQGLDPVRLPLEVCFHLVNKYREKCQKVSKGWKWMNDKAIRAMLRGFDEKLKCVTFKKGRVELPNGLALLYPGITANGVEKDGGGWFKGGIVEAIQNASYHGARSRNKLYGGLLTENIVQALARIKAAEAMLEIAQRYRVVLMEHDAVGYLALKSEAKEALAYGIEVMSTSPQWAPDIPLAAEGKYDVCYPK